MKWRPQSGAMSPCRRQLPRVPIPVASCKTPAYVRSDSTDLSVVEHTTIANVLQECRGNKTRAARRLGLSRTQLYVRIRKYRLEAASGAFPASTWKSIRTRNTIETLNREFRRRTKPRHHSAPKTPRRPCCMASWRSGRFNCGRSMATSSCLRSLRSSGRKSREDVKCQPFSSRLRHRTISTRLGTDPIQRYQTSGIGSTGEILPRSRSPCAISSLGTASLSAVQKCICRPCASSPGRLSRQFAIPPPRVLLPERDRAGLKRHVGARWH
jgi:Bacterial regulatory protein, Fis family